MRNFAILLFLLNLAYLAWSLEVFPIGVKRAEIAVSEIVPSSNSLILLSEVQKSPLSLGECLTIEVFFPTEVNNDPLEGEIAQDLGPQLQEMTLERKQEEKLCETIAPEG